MDKENKKLEFLGKSWAFPVRWEHGDLVTSYAETSIKESIYLILKTAVAERVMHPEFGCGIDNYVFAPASRETCFRLTTDIELALLRYEPRVIVNKVSCLLERADEGIIDVLIDYTVDCHRRKESLIFPYYLQRGQRI